MQFTITVRFNVVSPWYTCIMLLTGKKPCYASKSYSWSKNNEIILCGMYNTSKMNQILLWNYFLFLVQLFRLVLKLMISDKITFLFLIWNLWRIKAHSKKQRVKKLINSADSFQTFSICSLKFLENFWIYFE